VGIVALACYGNGMCGRFTSTTQPSLLAERFRAEPVGVESHQPSWNVAPASDILVIFASEDGARRLQALHWGLVPKWAKEPSSRNQIVNLRAETVRDKKSWQRNLARRRCIIPIDGFYEWQNMGKGQKKQPIYITAREPQPLALAGLWDKWHPHEEAKAGNGESGPAGNGGADGDMWTCTILTTTPNKLLEPVHNRMPVILPPEVWDTWLDPENTDAERLKELLVPAPDDLLACWPVDPSVGNVRNNHPELTEPLEGHEPRTADAL
jgi:putative SOS response-associated peptidase YedK